jgi:fatty-acid desaturase
MTLILYCLLIYLVAGISASITYHRILTHRSVEVVPWFERVLVILALPAGTPIQWVGTHRQHHRFTDVEGDPHSPHLFGFWYAHCGWYIQNSHPIVCILYALGGPARMLFDGFWRSQTNQQYNHLAKDLLSKKFFVTVSQPITYAIIMTLYCAAIVVPAYYFWDVKGVIAVWIALVLVYNIGDSVNSFAHLFGEATSVKNQSRNNIWLIIFGFGEGWHSYHHAHPGSGVFSLKKHNQDGAYLIVKAFQFIGLVKKINKS